MEQLVEQYRSALADERLAKDRRRELGAEIAAQLEHPEEGSKTHKIGGYKVTVKGGLNRRVDWDAFDLIECEHPPCRVKRELDAVGLRWFRDNDPDTYARLCGAITTTIATPQITVKEK